MQALCFITGITLLGFVSSSKALPMADNLRGCFANIEDQTAVAVAPSNAKLVELLDKAKAGRQMIDKCQSANPTNPNFAWCAAGQADVLRVDSLKALDELQRELSDLSNKMAAVVNDVVDCVSMRLQGGRNSRVVGNPPALSENSVLLGRNVVN